MRFALATATALTLGFTIGSAASGETAPGGAQMFKQRCQSCHTVAPGAKGLMGPNLSGVFGRKAGSSAFSYSPAMKASGITWTKDSLDKFLSGPSKMVPGSRMPMSVPDPAQRKAIIAYLAGGS